MHDVLVAEVSLSFVVRLTFTENFNPIGGEKMPLNVRRFYTSVFLVLAGFILFAVAQTPQPASSPGPQATESSTVPTVIKTPTAGEIMRERISKAKAFIAVRNYNAAIYELENIRRETADASVQAVVSVLLMNSYLEQGDYKKAQDFLNEAYNLQKTTKPNATANYLAIASQVVKGARSRVDRYRALGLNVSDRTLPLEAVNDLEKMRDTLEIVITQSKEAGKDKAKTQDAMALLEEAANSRSLMARDDYDARRWKDVVADTREQVATSRSIVVNAVNDGMPDTPVMQTQQTQTNISTTAPQVLLPATTTAANITLKSGPADQKAPPPSAADSGTLIQKTVMQSPALQPSPKPDDKTVSDKQEPPKTLVISNRKPDAAETAAKPDASSTSVEAAKESGPLDVGSLLEYATRQSPPVYPAAARNMRSSGIVKVEVTVDENGDVAAVDKAVGPPLLQGAAKDAVKKWRFKPFVRDGQPVKATGFINFNFTL